MTGIIILAAGQSTRMGKPKQKLPYKHNTLLQHTINIAIQSPYRPVVVVLGAFADEILPDIPQKPIEVIINTQWEEGMASSIRAGISYLKNTPDISNALIMLCDQPHVSSKLLNDMLQKKQSSGKSIIACKYNNTKGVPVLFDKKYFGQLLDLSGHEGAKKILSAYAADTETVPFPLGSVDIDTVEDYKQL